MKTKSFFLILIILSGNFIYSQQSDPIKDYPGIPILTYIGDQLRWLQADSVYKKMDTAGIFGTEVANIHYNNYPAISETNLKIIPNQVDDTVNNPPVLNYINRYTDAYYSVWEAEGTPPQNGDATVYYKSNIGEIHSGAVRTKTSQGVVNDTLIYGPYYEQEIKYVMVENERRIEYRADFSLKIEELIPSESSPTDTICILQVTTSHADTNNYRVLDSTYVIKDTVLLFGDLADTFKTFSLNYYMGSIPSFFTSDTSLFRAFASYIQYKVLWKGNSDILRLYVDNIILSDERGRYLKDTTSTPSVADLIYLQISGDFGSDYANRVAGWMGLDEPWSIDQFEPIRIVQNIVDQYGQNKELWLATGTGYNGRWGVNVPVGKISPFGTYQLQTFEEFYKRVGKANLWSDYYLYGYDDGTYEPYEYRDIKIRYMVDSVWGQYKNKEDVYWGVSISTGKLGDTSVTWLQLREIESKDLLYNVNIALLAGAKLISLWTYFVNHDHGDPWTRTALVNIDWPTPDRTEPPLSIEYTYKWYTLKDTIAPRLNGLMGKTLKKLNAVNHKLGIDALVEPQEAIPPYDYIDYIHAYGGQNDTCLVELGIFEDPQDTYVKYFMPLNRYYSNKHNLNFGLKNLVGYKNWKVNDFVDTTHFTVVANYNKALFSDTIYPGDAKLYSVSPVVMYGGKLEYNDTIKTITVELIDNMTIKDGVELIIESDYVVKDTVTLQGTGFITGDGYFYLEEDGAININDWDRSVFKSRNGNYPKQIWGRHPTFEVESYTIYKKFHHKISRELLRLIMRPLSIMIQQ